MICDDLPTYLKCWCSIATFSFSPAAGQALKRPAVGFHWTYLKHGWLRPFEMPIDWILNPKSSNVHHPPAHVSRGHGATMGRPWSRARQDVVEMTTWICWTWSIVACSDEHHIYTHIYIWSHRQKKMGISLYELIGIPLASMTPLQILSPAVLHKSQVGHKMMLLWPTTTYNRLYTTTYTIYTWWILPLFFPIKKVIWGYTPFSDTNYYIIWSWKCAKNYRKNIPIDVLNIIIYIYILIYSYCYIFIPVYRFWCYHAIHIGTRVAAQTLRVHRAQLMPMVRI